MAKDQVRVAAPAALPDSWSAIASLISTAVARSRPRSELHRRRRVPPEPVEQQGAELGLVEAQQARVADLLALQPELRRQGEDPARAQHAEHLLDAAAHVREVAEVLDRARGEDRVEGIVLELELHRVHVADGQPLGVPLPVPVAAGVGEHVGARVALGPVVLGSVEVGGDDLADVPGEPVDRRLAPRPDAEDPGVVAQDAERPERPQRHRHLPVLAVLAPRREVRVAEVLESPSSHSSQWMSCPSLSSRECSQAQTRGIAHSAIRYRET